MDTCRQQRGRLGERRVVNTGCGDSMKRKVELFDLFEARLRVVPQHAEEDEYGGGQDGGLELDVEKRVASAEGTGGQTVGVSGGAGPPRKVKVQGPEK